MLRGEEMLNVGWSNTTRHQNRLFLGGGGGDIFLKLEVYIGGVWFFSLSLNILSLKNKKKRN